MLLSARAPSAAATRRQSVCLAPQRASLRCVAPARSRARDVAVDAVSPNDTVALSLGEVLVSDLMTKPPVCVSPETSVFDVLELLVKNRISGLPVVGSGGEVLGMVSGYDLLVLDATPGHLDKTMGLFPPVGTCEQFGGSLSRMWNAFQDHQDLMAKAGGRTVGDVCHEAATISHKARLEDAADVIVRKKVHRLAVVDDNQRCVGVISRGDLLAATYGAMTQIMAK